MGGSTVNPIHDNKCNLKCMDLIGCGNIYCSDNLIVAA